MPCATISRASCGARLVRHGEHGARVALGQLAALDHREHVVGQLEQAQLVRDRGFERPTRSATSPSESSNSSISTA
jgi:hypothetical protein